MYNYHKLTTVTRIFVLLSLLRDEKYKCPNHKLTTDKRYHPKHMLVKAPTLRFIHFNQFY